MAIVKRILEIPVTAQAGAPAFLDPTNVEKYHYRLDVFYDDTWNIDIQRKAVIYFAGAGLNAPYEVTHPAPIAHIAAGYIWMICYYYQPAFNDPNSPIKTIKPPFDESWQGFNGVVNNYSRHLRNRAMMVQSALEYVCSGKFNLLDIVDADTEVVYLTGKSRGGASLLAWSYLSTNFQYSANVKAIINFEGYVGSADTDNDTDGWINFRPTITTLSSYFTYLQHKTVNVYNDLDHGYELSAYLAYSIPYNRLVDAHFANLMAYGHTAVWGFSVAVINAMEANVPIVYEGVTIQNASYFADKAWSKVYVAGKN